MGIFSVVIVDMVEPPLARMITAASPALSCTLNAVLTLLFAADLVKSAQAAAGLKKMLIKLSANNARLAAAEAGLNRAVEILSADAAGLKEKFAEAEAAFAARSESARERGAARREAGLRLLVKLIEKERRARCDRIRMIDDKAAAALELIARASAGAEGKERERLERRAAAIRELRESLHRSRRELASLRARDYSRAVSLLRRNPTASSRRHAEALGSLTEINRAKHRGIRQ